MSTIATRSFPDAFDDVRALLNDRNGDVYHDDLLLPYAALVMGELQDEFSKHGIPLAETVVSNLSYTANAETITLSALTDLQYPLELWEKPTSGDLWVPMKRVSRVPPQAFSKSVLGSWEWLNGAVRVPRCSVNRTVFMRYRRQLAYPDSESTMGFEGVYWPLCYGTAVRAAESTARENLVPGLAANYYKRMGDSVHIASRDRQSISFQQKPYRHRRRERIFIGED